MKPGVECRDGVTSTQARARRESSCQARVKSKDSPELYAPGTAMSPSVESNYRQQKTMFKEFNLAVTEAVISQNQSSKI